MDVQLQELIDKIKKDGVTAAEAKAAEIIESANKKAESIIAAAQEKSSEIIKKSKAETERMEKASEEAITQAGRNMLLSFKDSLIKELDSLILSETTAAESKTVLEKLVPETVKAWAKNHSQHLLKQRFLKVLKLNLIRLCRQDLESALKMGRLSMIIQRRALQKCLPHISTQKLQHFSKTLQRTFNSGLLLFGFTVTEYLIFRRKNRIAFEHTIFL